MRAGIHEVPLTARSSAPSSPRPGSVGGGGGGSPAQAAGGAADPRVHAAIQRREEAMRLQPGARGVGGTQMLGVGAL